MPISIDEFESGGIDEPSVPERVVRFLASNDDRAFTRAELADVLDADANAIGTALSRLKSRGLVRHRGRHWAITDDRERLEAAYDLHSASGRLDADDGGIDADAWDERAPEEPHPSERDDEDA